MKHSTLQAHLRKVVLIALLFTFYFSGLHAYSQENEELEDKTISPFFYVECTDSTIDALPLKSTKVKVNISGIIADATIMQRYVNSGTKTLEATYVFPLSTKAAVYYLKMYIGDRIITAVVKEKEQAQQEYEEAIAQGRTATLLEQQRPNVVQMKVGNILPADTIEIEIKYTELITPVDGIYEFVYPTVVGPRYFSQAHSDPNDSSWVEIPYTHEGENPLSTFHIQVLVNGGMPIAGILCPSHDSIDINFLNESQAKCQLTEGDSLSGNKDFILDYILSGDEHKTGILLYEGEDENFFLSMIQPPQNTQTDQIPPREYVFILDISGSMSGFPMETSKSLITSILQGLNVFDKFNILCFAGGSAFLFDESKEANAENIAAANEFIASISAGGGTELLPALQKALAYPTDHSYSRTFVIATDGYVTVENQAFDLIRNNLNKANFFAFGIGSAVNRFIIEGIAHVGMGEPFVVTKPEEAQNKAALFRKYIEAPVLTNISSSFTGFETYDVEPLSIPDVFAERPVIVFGKWNAPKAGQLQVDGISGYNNFSKTLNLDDYSSSDQNIALRYLWARYRIQLLDDYGQGSANNPNKDQIVALGLKYNLLTQYTSFIAIDSMIRNENGELTTVTVPNPMPNGVSDAAVGNWITTDITDCLEYQPTESRISYLYPNPFIDNTTLIVSLLPSDFDKEKHLEIFDETGRFITRIDISSLNRRTNKITLPNAQQLHKGIYIITLRINGAKVSTSKFIKV
ncbi:MAG: VIT domain-containing protein [Prolixibacteraceae bacterium]